MNMHLASELLSSFELIRTTDKTAKHIQDVSHSPVSGLIRTTDKNGWTHLASELLSSIWVGQNHWWKWLNMHLESELLFNVWAGEPLMRATKYASSKWVAL